MKRKKHETAERKNRKAHNKSLRPETGMQLPHIGNVSACEYPGKKTHGEACGYSLVFAYWQVADIFVAGKPNGDGHDSAEEEVYPLVEKHHGLLYPRTAHCIANMNNNSKKLLGVVANSCRSLTNTA
jgi:hypothetical protein